MSCAHWIDRDPIPHAHPSQDFEVRAKYAQLLYEDRSQIPKSFTALKPISSNYGSVGILQPEDIWERNAILKKMRHLMRGITISR